MELSQYELNQEINISWLRDVREVQGELIGESPNQRIHILPLIESHKGVVKHIETIPNEEGYWYASHQVEGIPVRVPKVNKVYASRYAAELACEDKHKPFQLVKMVSK